MPLPLLETVFKNADSKLPPLAELTDFGDIFEWVGFERQGAETVKAWKQRLERALLSSLTR